VILPIYALGQPVLKQIAKPIQADFPGLAGLLEDMWQTMYHASGVGLAAPQIGKGIRLFLVDTLQITEKEHPIDGIKQVFINAQVIEESGKPWSYEEGCLSIPYIRGEVMRQPIVRIKYQDEAFNWHETEFKGINARVIQHEYDHTEGKLFIDLLKPIKKQLIGNKLKKITLGEVTPDYKMKFNI